MIVRNIDLPPGPICYPYGPDRAGASDWGFGSDLRARAGTVSDWGDDFCAFASNWLQHRFPAWCGCEVRRSLCQTKRRFFFGVSVYGKWSGSDGKSQEVTTETRRTKNRKTKLTTAPDQLQSWSAQVLSLEYKNTWFSEDGGRNTLRSTKCLNGVSQTFFFFLFKHTRKPRSVKCSHMRNTALLLRDSRNRHQTNV